jgi:hypothetical protein
MGESRLKLDSWPLTGAFWGSAALFSLAFWVRPFPPLIDYPQHVAVAALLRRMADPSSPERSLYDVNLVTYNGGFHLLVAALSFVVRPEVAAKAVMSLYPPLLAFGGLELVRACNRPSWYAFFLIPITFSYVVGWGFANYVISLPLVLLGFAYWYRAQHGEKRMLWRVMALSAVLAYTHVLATLCLCVSIGIAGMATWRTLGSSWTRRALSLIRLPIAVWPAIVWSVVVFVRNRNSPHANWEGWDDGLDQPLWYKLLHVTAYAVGNFTDQTDQVLLAAAVAIMILLWQHPDRGDGNRVAHVLALAWGGLYCVIPRVFIATWFIFERFPTFVLAFAAAAMPEVRSSKARWMRNAAAGLAVAAGVNTVWHLARIPDEGDADAILDDIPEGKRVVAVTWSNDGGDVVLREMWVHLLAYYQARRPGQIGYSFAKFESMPVHYRIGRAPPAVPGGMEWFAERYDPRAPYARYWDTVLVRTPDDAPDADPRPRTFGRAAPGIKILSRRGRFWLLDATALHSEAVARPTNGRGDEWKE